MLPFPPFTRSVLLATLVLALTAPGAARAEYRATWLARDSLVSKETLAAAMATAASNHFNVVLVNCWSRGYPLWRSQVFSNETGMAMDPNYPGRDILAEAVAEGHQHGLRVLAWFEYGFVGGWTGYFPGTSGKGKIFDAHPDWVARTVTGSEMDTSNFYWMVHTRPDVQDFLIALKAEVLRHYDLDGLEFDRIRYPSLGYGYDAYTTNFYAQENGGALPPAQTNNAAWIRWRADKLNAFHARAYDTLKDLQPSFLLANAPSAYSSSAYSAYISFAQDWVWWLNRNKVDRIELQSYVSTATSFSNILRYVATQVNDVSRISPAYAVRPNGNWIDYAEMLKFVDVARQGSFGGQAGWYFTDLNTSNYFGNFRVNRYPTPVAPPGWPADWRDHRRVLALTNTADAVRTGPWTPSANAGLTGPSLFAAAGSGAALDYHFDVPVNGVYEVYAFLVPASGRSTNAPLIVFDADGAAHTNRANQTVAANARWFKLGDYRLAAGRQRVLQIATDSTTGNVGADAAMISLHRRLSRVPELAHAGADSLTNGQFRFQLRGNAGQQIRVESSTNAVNWTPLTTVTLTNASRWLVDSNPPASARFYRAVLP